MPVMPNNNAAHSGLPGRLMAKAELNGSRYRPKSLETSMLIQIMHKLPESQAI